MAYCEIAEVQALNPERTYDDSSTPTTTQVNALITQIAVEIDAILQAKGYTIPVTTPDNFVEFLKYVNAYGAAALADKGMFPATSEMGQTQHWQVMMKIYQGWLKDLKEGKATPSSLAVSSASSELGSYYTEMSDTDDFPEPAFRKRSDDKDF